MDEEDDEPVLFESEQIWFGKNDDGHYYISSLDGSLSLRFAASAVSAADPHGESGTHYPLVAVEDGNGNHQRFIYHPQSGLPQYIIDGNGRVFELHFADVGGRQRPLPRLSSVSLLPSLPPFGTAGRGGRELVRYQYDEAGDLIRVLGRDGSVRRHFGYRNHILTEHGDAAGLVSYYEYDHYDAGGKVLRNRTSLGEEWHFSYHDGYRDLVKLLKLILREKIWCKLCSRNCEFHFGYDYYLYCICNKDLYRFFDTSSMILNIEKYISPYMKHKQIMRIKPF